MSIENLKMLLMFLAATTAVLGHPQNLPSQELLDQIFGKPTAPKLEDIMVTTTIAPSTYKDKNGASCQCVPYHLCDSRNVSVHLTDSKRTGWGVLDIRFGTDDECQESVEVCCTRVISEEQIPTQAPPVVKGCGYRNPNGIDFSISGGNGNEAEFGEFPWVVAIMNAQNGEYGGVGVLIHPQVVMTGAHIASKFNKILVRAGEWDTQTVKERLKYQEQLVDKVVMREDFRKGNLFNDMALLHLTAPVQIDSHINVICLPDQNEDFDSAKSCYANGWGKDVFGQQGRYAVILKKVELDMVPFNKCNSLLKTTRLGNWFDLHQSFVCAGGQARKDTCQGDGGAPLVCPVGDNRYKLTGLVAWGIGCGEEGNPGAYVRVSMFRNWVDEVMSSWGLPTDGYRI